MAGKAKQSALDAFKDNIHDAYILVSLAEALTNTRQRRMRREKREAVGEALRINHREREALDCIESDDFFVVLKPGSAIKRDDVKDVRPLLRQALVAGAAAVETYVVDRVMERMGRTLRGDGLPGKLRAVPLTVDDHLAISKYQRPGWGLRRLLRSHVEELASLAPSQIGRAFDLVGEQQILRRVDKRRDVKIGTTVERLDRINARRNKIAHTADRAGRGRANLTTEEVRSDLDELVAVVETLEQVTAG